MPPVMRATTQFPCMVRNGVSYMSESSCGRICSPPLPVKASGRNDWPARSFQLSTVEIPGANSTRLRADLSVGSTDTHDPEPERPLHAGGGSRTRGSHDDRPMGSVDTLSGWIRKLVHAPRGAAGTTSDHFRCHHH